jgi:pimeloyl-ACP methyl ester carboxylesterase
VQEYAAVRHIQSNKRRRIKRLIVAGGIVLFSVFFLFLPVALSFLITNSHFRFPERGPKDPEALGLRIRDVEFQSEDGVQLRGWWSAGDSGKPIIIFVHGLNRSRFEHLERAAESNKRGYGVLLFDLRNHGKSADAHTTLGIHESRDVCAARKFLQTESPGSAQVVWGVSLGASTALLAERRCPGASAIISDSSFLSFSETIKHHFNLVFHLPSFPVADMIIALTSWRMGFSAQDGDVEAAVAALPDVPILFVAGGADARMPPELAQRLASRASNPRKQVLVVPGAGHGQAFAHDPEVYLRTAFDFLEDVKK